MIESQAAGNAGGELPKSPPVIVRSVADVALALHAAGAAAYWWLSPKGFPVANCRFWLNSVFPFALVILAVWGLVEMHRRRWANAATLVVAFASIWCAGAIGGRILFPVSLHGLWIFPLIVSACGFLLAVLLVRIGTRPYRLWFAAALLAAPLGLFLIWAQVPAAAATEPLDIEPSTAANAQEWRPLEPMRQGGATAVYDATAASFLVRAGNIRVRCMPFLNFDRVTQDGFWSLRGKEMDVSWEPKSQWSDGAGQVTSFTNGAVAMFAPVGDEPAFQFTAFTPVLKDTYSHLNTFCDFKITGHKRLSLSFSPCPDESIEVLPSDYPVGRPERMAFVDRENTFRVVEAKSGEKGPFRTLASGTLHRGDPLTIVLHDEGQTVAWLKLDDWSRQVSTELSPTAGWGLPMNAIEFQRFNDDPASDVEIWISLAATSVGRGWETVGHRAGVYRNELEFRVVTPREEHRN